LKLTTVFTILVIIAFAGIMIYFLAPLLMQNTYEGKLVFNTSSEAKFEGRNYHMGGSTLGSFELKARDTVLVEEKGNPCGSSCLQYNYIFLIDQKEDKVVDVAKFTVVNPSSLTPPYDGTFTVGIGVIKTILYEAEKSSGTWNLEITVKKGF